jgi:SET family sugar efflux transporter-like MFS transporter
MKSLTLITAVAILLFMSRGIIGPISSLYVESLGASYVVIGLLGTVTSLTTILFSYIWGRASDRLGQRKVLLAPSLATLAVSYGLMAFAPSYEYLFPLHVLGAVAQAAYGTASLALMGDLLEQSADAQGRRMGIYRGLGSLGFGLTAFLSGTVADWLSIRVSFVLSALFLALAFFLALRVEEAPPADGPRGEAEPSPAAGNSTASASTATQSDRPAGESSDSNRLPLVPLLVSAFLWSLVTGAVYAVWANYMVSEIHYTQAQMSRLWALASLSEFPLMILAGHLSDRMGRLPMLSLGFLAWTLVFLGYILVPVMPWIVLIQLTRGFAYSAFTATSMTYAAEVRSRSQRGQVSGLYNSAGGIGTILGSSMGGTLAQFTSFRIMIGTNAALIFGGAVYLALAAVRQTAFRQSTAPAALRRMRRNRKKTAH